MNIENIKFKAKHLDNGEWVFGDLLHSYENGAIIVPIGGGGAFSVDPSSVCQFTGLTDCEGNEIWEGDILQSTDGSSNRFLVFQNNFGAFFIRRESIESRRDAEKYDVYLFEISNTEYSITRLKVVGNRFNKEE